MSSWVGSIFLFFSWCTFIALTNDLKVFTSFNFFSVIFALYINLMLLLQVFVNTFSIQVSVRIFFTNIKDKIIGVKFKLFITDKNGEAKKDDNSNIMYQLRPLLNDLLGRNFNILYPDTGLPTTHITIGKPIDDYKNRLDKHIQVSSFQQV